MTKRITKNELAKVLEAILVRDKNAVNEFNGYCGSIDDRLNFVAGRAEDALNALVLVLCYLSENDNEGSRNETD